MPIPARLDHAGDEGDEAVDDAAEADAHDPVEIRVGGGLRRAEDVDAGVEDQQVGDAAEDLLGLIRRLCEARAVGDVPQDVMDRGVLVPEVCPGLVHVILAVVGDHDLHTRLGEDLCVGKARTAGAAGDKRDLSGKLFHGFAPLFSVRSGCGATPRPEAGVL